MSPRPTPSVAELMRRDLGAMTPNERRAAHRLLADYPVAGLDTVAAFGKAAAEPTPAALDPMKYRVCRWFCRPCRAFGAPAGKRW